MTRAFDYSNQDMSANPLFAKLRNRFIDAENCTIGEIMLKKAENDGYKCSANVSSSVRAKSNFSKTSEYYITRGNSLPSEESDNKAENQRRHRKGLIGIVALFMLCSVMLTYLVLNRINFVKDNVADDAEPVVVAEENTPMLLSEELE